MAYNFAKINPIKIAFWKGITLGFGIPFTIHSDFKIANETTPFAFPGSYTNKFILFTI